MKYCDYVLFVFTVIKFNPKKDLRKELQLTKPCIHHLNVQTPRLLFHKLLYLSNILTEEI